MQEALFASGRKAATKFLAGWDFDRCVDTYRSGRVIDLTGQPVAVDATEER